VATWSLAENHPTLWLIVSSGENHLTLWLVWVWGENHPHVTVRVCFLFPCWCLDIVKIDKTPLIYSFHISIWVGLVHCLGGLSPTNHTCDDGNDRMWDMKVNSSGAINLIAQQLWQSICPFWASLPYVLDFRIKFSHFGQGWLMWLKISMTLEKVYVST